MTVVECLSSAKQSYLPRQCILGPFAACCEMQGSNDASMRYKNKMYSNTSMTCVKLILCHAMAKEMVQFLSKNAQLREMELRETVVVHTIGVRVFANRLWARLSKHKKICCIKMISTTCLPVPIRGTLISFTKHKTLHSLEIRQCVLTIPTCQWILCNFTQNQSLQKLTLCYNTICDKGMALVCDTLGALNKIRYLDVSGNDFGDEGVLSICALLDRQSALDELICKHNDLGDDGMTRIAQSLSHNTTLKQLDVTSNDIGSTGMLSLATALSTNSCLYSLSIAGNYIDRNCTDRLCHALQCTRSVTFLDVSAVFAAEPSNVLSIIAVSSSILFLKLAKLSLNNVMLDMDLIERLSTGLASNTSLLYVNFAKNNLTLDMVYEFSKFLCTNKHVQTLDLSANNMGLHDCTRKLDQRFWSIIAHNTVLSSLMLGNNGLCNRSMYEAGVFLRKNATLSLLDLSGNLIGNIGIGFILQAMHANSHVKVLNVNNSSNFALKYSKLVSNLVKARICAPGAWQQLHVHGVSLYVTSWDLSMFNVLLPRVLRDKGLRPTNYDMIKMWRENCLLRKATFLLITHPRLSNGIWSGLSLDLIQCILSFCLL